MVFLKITHRYLTTVVENMVVLVCSEKFFDPIRCWLTAVQAHAVDSMVFQGDTSLYRPSGWAPAPGLWAQVELQQF